MAVFGAMISYLLQTASFILLRVKLPHMERPFRSPFGIGGAAIAGAIATLTLITLFITDVNYRYAAMGAAIWYIVGIAYFAFYSRKRLVYSPEEQFALKAREKEKTFTH